MTHAAEIVAATDLPVSADLEGGFGITLADIAETYLLAFETGPDTNAMTLRVKLGYGDVELPR